MALTIDVDGGRITSTEGTNADEVRAQIAALDASSKKDPPPATAPAESNTEVVESEGLTEQSQSTDASASSKPAPAIQQDREPDGTFKKGGKKDAQSRIAHVTWEREEAKRLAAAAAARAEAAERELAAIRERHSQATPKDAEGSRTAPAPPVGKPSADDIGTVYATYEDYVDALTDWKLDQRLAQQQAREQERAAQTQAQTQKEKFGERWAAWTAERPADAAEFNELMQASKGGPNLPPALWDAIIDHQRGPALLHYLASHPEECLQLIAEVQDLPRSAAPVVRRVLDSKLTAPAATPGSAPAVTRQPVPAPIQPVGASPVVSEVDSSSLDGKAYLEAENARYAARRKRQYGL